MLPVCWYAARCKHIPDEVERTPTIRHFVVTSYLQQSNPTRGSLVRYQTWLLIFWPPGRLEHTCE